MYNCFLLQIIFNNQIHIIDFNYFSAPHTVPRFIPIAFILNIFSKVHFILFYYNIIFFLWISAVILLHMFQMFVFKVCLPLRI